MTLAQKFINDRRILIDKYPSWNKIKIDDSQGFPILEIFSPQILSGFAGYLKFQLKDNCKVYFRGENGFHKTTIPSLFRSKNNKPIDNETIKIRKKAYNELVDSIPKLFESYRLKRENINPLLQHYGIKTDWIDLVDNIFIAIWFANQKSPKEYNYIKFFGSILNNSKLIVSDLRENHSSLSLRPHCQHGISITKSLTEWEIDNIDFTTNLIAIAKIPNNKNFNLKGVVFTKDFMFPNDKLDNTLKLFKMKKFTNRLNEIIYKNNLEINELGKIN